jgi:hypothetical protein
MNEQQERENKRQQALARSGVPCGHHRHFKGKVYEVRGIGLHTDTLEPFVIYHTPDMLDFWLRPKDDFLGHVSRPTYTGNRFQYLGLFQKPREAHIAKLEQFLEWCLSMFEVHGGEHYRRVRAEIALRFPSVVTAFDERSRIVEGHG